MADGRRNRTDGSQLMSKIKDSVWDRIEDGEDITEEEKTEQ